MGGRTAGGQSNLYFSVLHIMADFEKLYGEVLVTPTVSTVSFESVLAALADVALEVKETQEVILVDKDGAIFRKQDDGDFHLNPKMDYVIMRRTYPNVANQRRKPALGSELVPFRVLLPSTASNRVNTTPQHVQRICSDVHISSPALTICSWRRLCEFLQNRLLRSPQ